MAPAAPSDINIARCNAVFELRDHQKLEGSQTQSTAGFLGRYFLRAAQRLGIGGSAPGKFSIALAPADYLLTIAASGARNAALVACPRHKRCAVLYLGHYAFP